MLKLLKKLGLKEWIFFGISIVFIVGQVWLDLKLPNYMSEITEKLTNGTITMENVWVSGGLMIACAVGSAILAIATGFFSAKIAATLAKRIRSCVFNKINSFSLGEINKFSTASLITRSTNDITQVQNFVAIGLQVIIKAPILATWAIITILGKSWEWSVATAVAVAILLLVIICMIIFVVPKFKKIQTQTDNLNRVARENLTGVRVVRAYNAESFEGKKFEQANDDLTKTNVFVNRTFAIMSPVMTLIMNGLTLAIYWIGAFLINAQLGTLINAGSVEEVEQIYNQSAVIFGDMVVFIAYAMQVIMAFMMLIIVFVMLPRAIVSARRISEVLNTNANIKDGNYQGIFEHDELNKNKHHNQNNQNNQNSTNVVQNQDKIKTHTKKMYYPFENSNPTEIVETKKGVFAVEEEKLVSGKIEFVNVSFKYPNAENYVLQDISFIAEKGETVAFIGSTGSGKSTLINLIPRFYDCTKGAVLIDGINVKDYPLEDLYNKLGYIPQQAKMLSGTVESNISLGYVNGEKVKCEDMNEALQISQSLEFVNKMENKEKSVIAQGGTNISGGQKQRLSIARAIARKPEIFIFDDTFSALDYKTDKKLRKEISKHLSNSTCLIVAQRIGTIKNADKIMVLDNGKMVGFGKHKDLLKTCDVYKEIALSQLSKEELEE